MPDDVARLTLAPAPMRLGDDLLEGADAIAVELGFMAPDAPIGPKKKARNRVYYLGRHSHLPIWFEPGVGWCALRSQLRAYLEGKAQAALARCQGTDRAALAPSDPTP